MWKTRVNLLIAAHCEARSWKRTVDSSGFSVSCINRGASVMTSTSSAGDTVTSSANSSTISSDLTEAAAAFTFFLSFRTVASRRSFICSSISRRFCSISARSSISLRSSFSRAMRSCSSRSRNACKLTQTMANLVHSHSFFPQLFLATLEFPVESCLFCPSSLLFLDDPRLLGYPHGFQLRALFCQPLFLFLCQLRVHRGNGGKGNGRQGRGMDQQPGAFVNERVNERGERGRLLGLHELPASGLVGHRC